VPTVVATLEGFGWGSQRAGNELLSGVSLGEAGDEEELEEGPRSWTLWFLKIINSVTEQCRLYSRPTC
jgi:hypothetical protein